MGKVNKEITLYRPGPDRLQTGGEEAVWPWLWVCGGGGDLQRQGQDDRVIIRLLIRCDGSGGGQECPDPGGGLRHRPGQDLQPPDEAAAQAGARGDLLRGETCVICYPGLSLVRHASNPGLSLVNISRWRGRCVTPPGSRRWSPSPWWSGGAWRGRRRMSLRGLRERRRRGLILLRTMVLY